MLGLISREPFTTTTRNLEIAAAVAGKGKLEGQVAVTRERVGKQCVLERVRRGENQLKLLANGFR